MPTVVTYAIAYIASSAGIAIGLSAAGWAALGYIVTGAALLGFGNAQRRKAQRKARDAFNASLTDRLVMTSTTDGRRSRVYGRVRNVDGVVFKVTHGTLKQFYTLVVSVAGHEVDAIEQVYFGETPVDLDVDGYVTTAPWNGAKPANGQAVLNVTGGSGSVTLPNTPIGGSVPPITITTGSGDLVNTLQATPTVAGNVISITGAPVDGAWVVNYQYTQVHSKARVRKFLGGPSQDLSAVLIGVVGADLVTSADRFANDATLLCTFEYDQDAFPSGLPSVTAVVRGAKCLDPRTGAVAWTENPAVIAYDWARYEFGGGCDADEIVVGAFIAAANACDVSTVFRLEGGGTETRPLYQCGIAIPLEGGDPRDDMDEIVEAMAGQWCHSGGRVTTRAGVYRAPVASIDTSWLTDVRALEVLPQTATADLINVMRPRIADAAQGYIAAPTAPVPFPAARAVDGRERARETDYRGITHAVHAQHVAGVQMRESREGLTVTPSLNLKAFGLEVFDVAELNLPTFGFDRKLVEVIGWKFSLDGGVQPVLRETAAGIFDPDTNFDVLTVSPNTSLPSPTDVPQVTGVTVDSGTVDLLDKSLLVRTIVAWDAVASQAVRQSGRIEVQYLEATATLPSGDWPSLELAGDATSATIVGLRAGVHYLVRVRAKNTLRVAGPWSVLKQDQVAAAPKATKVTADVYDFAGAGYGNTDAPGFELRSVSLGTVPVSCNLEVTATLVASGLDGDSGRGAWWALYDGTTAVNLLFFRAYSTAKQSMTGAATVALTAGVTYSLLLFTHKGDIGAPSIFVYQSELRATEVRL